MFYPALREPAFPTSGLALQGPHGQDASALIAGLRVGANLAGMQQNLSYGTTFHLSTRLGTRDAYTAMMPGHPTFGFRGSAGVSVGNADFEEFIAVNQVGKRFFNEVRLPVRPGVNRYPGDGGAPGQGLDHTPLDWRNCRREWVREMYSYDHGLDAALAMNEGRSRQTITPARCGRSSTRMRSSVPAGNFGTPMSPTTGISSGLIRSRSWPKKSRQDMSSSGCR